MFDSVDPQRQSILARDAASVLNALASVATESTLQDGGELLPYNSDSFPRDTAGFLSGISQSAFPRPVEGSVNGINIGKKGRSKACDECRKSKRRCIHDEYGRIDPVKAQERSKPRAASSAKRPRPNEDGIDPVTNKKVKADLTAPVPSDIANYTGFEAIPTYLPASDTHVLDEEQYQQQYYKHDLDGLSTVQSPPEESFNQSMDIETADVSYAVSPNPKINRDAAMPTSHTQANHQLANPLASPPTSLSGETEVLPPQHPSEELHGGSVIVDGEHEALHTPNSSSRHSSRQPRQVDRYVPEQQAGTKQSTVSKLAAATSTIRQPTKALSTTSGHSKKSTSRPSSSHTSHTKKSASPSLEKKLAHSSTTSPSSSKNVKRERTSFTADDTTDADAESLRLIRELQEQDFGLRRRAARV
jgi:F-box/leucine-rich repeat protein 10/11